MSPGATSEEPTSGPTGGPEPAAGSERAVREGLAATANGAAALVPGGRPEERPAADGAEPRARAERRLRLQGLAGMTVLGSEGKTVGRVRDIYQQDAGGELAAITVMPRQLSSRSILIPSAAIAALPAEQADEQAAGEDEAADPHSADVVRLRVETAIARSGMRPPQTGHATAEMLREAAAALGLADAAPRELLGGHVDA